MTGIMMHSMSHKPVTTATVVYNLDAATFTGLSANFNGTTQYLEAYQTATINGDFTVEGWFYPTNVTGGHTLFSLGSETTYRYIFSLSGTSITSNFFGGSTTTYTSTVPINTWTHIAVVRSGSTVKVYINGTASATTDTQSGRVGNGPIDIGATNAGTAFFAGNISNFRLVGGSAVYTSNFTSSTTELTDIAGTQLLLSLNSLTSSNFIDTASLNGYPITNYNSVGLSLLYPFASKDTTQNYTITVSNTNSRISWNSANGGVFRSTYIGDAMSAYISGGPNYSNGNQSFTIFIAYKLATSSSGRLLNTGNEANGDFVIGGYNGRPKVYFTAAQNINLSGATADTVWHLDWATFNKITGVANLYSATSVQPTTYTYTATNTAIRGPNQLRLFNRQSGTEAHPADIGVIKVWDGALTLAQVQTEYAAYKTRFGY